MKKVIIITIALLAGFLSAQAQKIAYVNTAYIMQNIPEYGDAQTQLENFSVQWQEEIEEKFSEIDNLYKRYQKEAVLLPEEMKQKRENEIINKEKEVKELQKKRFGKDGDLQKKREELITPIQEKIYTAIEAIAKEENYAIILDKAGNATIIYSNPKYDISEMILDHLGYTYK
ncbi:MAG: OmpH family outer membrane protein [Lentimicrobiaceae bacterium]|nr:OmpH family outer membrane protein [Lentimicrobiaceae bacterium]